MPEATLTSLRARLAGLDALIAGGGDVRDLPVALLPEVSDAARAAVARVAATRPELASAADVDAAPSRAEALGVVAAVAALARHLPDPAPWYVLVDEVRYDVLGRPHAWRDLSDDALLLAEALDLTEETAHGSLLWLVARAALDAAPAEVLDAARAEVAALGRAATATRAGSPPPRR